MLDNEFPIPLDDGLVRIATVVVFAGALVMRLAGWTAGGLVLLAFGVVTIWLAHQVAIAPHYEQAEGSP